MTKCDDGVAKRRDQSFQIWCGSSTFGFRLASYSCSNLLDVQICFLIYAREGGDKFYNGVNPLTTYREHCMCWHAVKLSVAVCCPEVAA